jgi:hypothetical protein
LLSATQDDLAKLLTEVKAGLDELVWRQSSFDR